MFAFFPLEFYLNYNKDSIEIQGLPSSDCNFKDFQGACELWNGEAFILLGSLRNHEPTFWDATTGFPAKRRLRTEGRNSTLITRH